MSDDQLTRDQLLRQRLLAATNDADALAEVLADLTKDAPHAGSDQEERMRSIESSLSTMAWNCQQLKRYAEPKT